METMEQNADITQTVNGVERILVREVWHSHLFDDVEGASRWLNAMGAQLAKPHKLVTTTDAAGKLSIVLSNEIKLKLPHAFASFSIESVTEDGQWPTQIHYHDEDSMGKVTKTFNITYRKAFGDQVTEMQTSAKKAFKEIQDELNKKSGAAQRELSFKVIRSTNDLIKSIDVPDGFELELHQGLAAQLKIKRRHFSSDANEVAWIYCDIVGETRIGEGAMRLLNATPIKITTSRITQREYMPVMKKTFSIIDIKMHTSLKTMQIYDSPFNIIVVLHFTPRYKRFGCGCDQKRRRVEDESSSQFLQQTTSGWSNQNGL